LLIEVAQCYISPAYPINTLYYGDNLKILRDYIKDESVDLVYLDPPFNSNRNYNVLFRNETGSDSESQIAAFEDTWHWNQQAEQTYHELINEPDQVGRMIESLRVFIGHNQMMAVRLKELHRVLKPTGSLYLHCDPTASHYLKILLDTVFGPAFFKNEITWKRKTGRGETQHKSNRFGVSTGIILFYSKSDHNVFNSQFNADAAGFELREIEGPAYWSLRINWNPDVDGCSFSWFAFYLKGCTDQL
jgi:site-specific DNA-methyltransferase (adenine-specific)